MQLSSTICAKDIEAKTDEMAEVLIYLAKCVVQNLGSSESRCPLPSFEASELTTLGPV